MENSIDRKLLIKGYICIVLAAFMYSTQEIAGKKLALFKLDPYQVIFWAFFVAIILMIAPTYREMKKRKIKLKTNDFGYFTVIGILCVPLSMTALQMSLSYINAATVAVIISTTAIFAIPLSFIILKEKITKKMGIGLIVSIIGLLILINPESMIDSRSARSHMIGVGLAFFAAIVFSLYTVISKKRVQKYGGMVLNFFSFVIGDIVLFIGLLISGRPIIDNITSIEMVILLIIMGLLVKFLGYIFYQQAIESTSATVASTTFMIKPIIGPILAIIFLGEALHLNFWIGVIVIIIGSYIIFKCKLNREG
ncbi:MAG: DMT family transporter [Clostridium sp.]